MWSPMSHWHGKGNRNDARRTGVNSKCSVFQVLNEVLENLSKINLHLADVSLIWSPGLWKTETNSQCDGLTHRLPFCLGWLGVEGRIFPPVFSFSSSTESFVILTKATIISTSKCIYKYSLRWSNWPETQTALRVPGFSSFHPSTFQLTTGRITRNSSKFLALEVPMIPAGMQKKGCFFFPLKIMYFPGTVQMPQMRQMRDLFWPTNEKTSPFWARALRFSSNKHKVFVSKET